MKARFDNRSRADLIVAARKIEGGSMRKQISGVLASTKHRVGAISMAAVLLLFGSVVIVAQEKSREVCTEKSCSTNDSIHPYGMGTCGDGFCSCYGCGCRSRRPYPSPPELWDRDEMPLRFDKPKPWDEPLHPNRGIKDLVDRRDRARGEIKD